MEHLVVAKIGGSILRDSQGIRDALKLVKYHPQIKVLVVSATFNTTNELEEIAKSAINKDNLLDYLLKKISIKHLNLMDELDLPEVGREEVLSILKIATELAYFIRKDETLSAKTMDELYSIGELLSSVIIKRFFERELPLRRVIYLDARHVIKTDSNFGSANPLKKEIFAATLAKMPDFLYENSLIIVPGFIGSNLKGETTTLGREGSDYSAALLAEALRAGELQIWKDVPGIFTGDPKIVKNAKSVGTISFEEINLFSEKGAKILFPRALIPVMEANIPVYIGWVQDFSKGTRIFRKPHDNCPRLIGVTRLENFLRIELEKKNQEISDLRFLENIKIILDKVSYQALYQDGHRFFFHISMKSKMPQEKLALLEEISSLNKFPNISMICIVGIEMVSYVERILKLVSDLEKEGISLILCEKNPNFLTFSFPSRMEGKVMNFMHDQLFLNK